jgi:hypothetical protein
MTDFNKISDTPILPAVPPTGHVLVTNPSGIDPAKFVFARVPTSAISALASSTPPAMDGTAAPGTASTYSRGDHVHPTDTSRYDASNPAGYQTAAQVAAAQPPASTNLPGMDGAAAVGVSGAFARGDHVHPTDVSRAAVTALPGLATTATPGLVKPDGTSITVDGAGKIAAVGGVAIAGGSSGQIQFNNAGPLGGFTMGGDGTLNTATGALTVTKTSGVPLGAAATAGYGAAAPVMDGTAAAGSATTVSRSDHVHPSDTSRAPLASPALTGTPTVPTAAVGTNTTQAASTAFVQAAVAPAANNVGRNLVHNSLFNIAQRGVGPFTVGYTLDRWSTFATNDTLSITQTALVDADRAAIGDEAATVSLKNVFTGSATAGSLSFLQQPIEGVRRLGGKTVTVSFWAKAGSALKLGLNMNQVLGSGGSPSSGAWIATTGTSFTLTTTMARYTATFAVPSVAGKTLGTNGDDSLQLAFWFSASATYSALSGNIGVQSGTIQLWGVQLEVGSVATALEKPDPQQDLARCQRFYQALNTLTFLGTLSAGGQTFGQSLALPVAMRATPTMALNGTSYSNASGLTGYPTQQTLVLYALSVAAGGSQWATGVTLAADL